MISNIAKAAGVSPNTVESYFQILEDTMIGKLIPAYHTSVRRQLTQSSRFYFFDCGVLNQLRGELRTELRPSSYRYGKLFDTFVIKQIIAANDYFGTGFTLHHWRTTNNIEVDLVLVGS